MSTGPHRTAQPAERRRPPLWLSIVACSVPMFMVALDSLAVSTALRTVAAESQPDTTDLQWFVTPTSSASPTCC
ncbi:hypothetical protein NC658_19325 [Streptomyces griseoincarnatus]|uniref:Major facilitator superfamily (MFS) profile domain-containing protein n=1 Tax=Streptomyces griseoincarnatus TaxID=29305 RepID=A0ABT0VWR2_STRGI|nr:hypothetical protein [Streptomyces griseoincarnatus]MCM2515390.1 hypothetical protein [Streptomyces griseoincarnatus]